MITQRGYHLPPALLPAALAGRLTQLWLPLKVQPKLQQDGSLCFGWASFWDNGTVFTWDNNGTGGENWNANDHPREDKFAEALKRTPYKNPCPYPVGTRLFCKEAWFDNRSINGDTDSEVLYRADGEIHQQEECVDGFTGWRPARSMPAWAARIWFEVVSVAMRRAESVTHRECCESGWPGYEKTSGDLTYNERDWIITTGDGDDACIEWFADLYDRQHGPGSFERDWCWVYVVKAIGVSE